MLGATETPFETPADVIVRRSRAGWAQPSTFERTTVAVDFDVCVRCGGCMVGCRYGAKNTLDRNYLRQAEAGGARRACRPRGDAPPPRRRRLGGRDRAPGRLVRKRPERFRAQQVVLAAGVLGTVKLLLRSGVGGPNVGELVRSNSEVIVGAGARDTAVDYSEGIAIGSSFDPNPHTRIEPVRYPKGSSLMGLFSTVLVDGGGRLPRPLRWLATLGRHRSARCRRTCRTGGRSAP